MNRQSPLAVLKRPARRAAFTLIELLVVVAIIGLLAAILLPALNRARSVAKQAQCMDNVRNWTLVSLMYADENGGWFPARGPEFQASNAPNVVGSAFRAQLERYGLKANSSFCPEGAVQPAVQTQYYSIYGGGMGYTYYPYLVGLAGPRPAQKVTDVYDDGGRLSLLFADVNRYWTISSPLHTNHRDPAGPAYAIPTEFGWCTIYCGIPRGLNNAYIDGHAEWIRFDRLDQTVSFLSVYGDYSYHWSK